MARRPAGRSLTGRASLNALASGLDYGARAVVELVVSPLIVGGLGAAVYGAWRVLWQWSSYVWGASGRSAQALQYAIANRQWTATDQEKRQLVGAALLVWVLFIPLVLTAGVLGVWLVPHLLDVPADQVTPLRVAAAILVVDALAVTVLTLPRSALVGENLGYTRMGASTALVIVGGGLMVGAVQLDLGLPGLAGATLLTTVLTGLVFWLITRKRLPWFGASRPSRSMARWFVGLSAWFLGWKLVLELMIASDVLVLALFVPLSVVAAFALTKWVADAMNQVLGLLVQATIPGIGGYLGSGARDRAAGLRGEVMSLVWVLGTAAGTAVIVWNETFVGLWVGDHLYAGSTVTLLLVVLAFQLALIRTDTFVIDVALVPTDQGHRRLRGRGRVDRPGRPRRRSARRRDGRALPRHDRRTLRAGLLGTGRGRPRARRTARPAGARRRAARARDGRSLRRRRPARAAAAGRVLAAAGPRRRRHRLPRPRRRGPGRADLAPAQPAGGPGPDAPAPHGGGLVSATVVQGRAGDPARARSPTSSSSAGRSSPRSTC